MQGELRQAVLLSVTPDNFLAAERYLDDVVRECQLIAVGEQAGLDVPRHLERLADEMLQVMAVRDELHAQVVTAAERGEAAIDVIVTVKPEGPARVRRLLALLEDFEEAARAGRLLAVPSDPEISSRLRWALNQVADQVANGVKPQPYEATRDA